MATRTMPPDPDDFDSTDSDDAHVVDLDAARTRKTRSGEPLDSHFDATLDEEPQPGGIPVEAPPADRKGRQPIVPLGLSTWGAIKSTIKYGLGLAGYHAAFHAVRSPWYAVQAVFWAAVGVFRLVGRQLRWWWVTEQTGLRQKAADDNDPQMWHKLHREVKATRAWRFWVLTGEALALVLGAPILYGLAP